MARSSVPPWIKNLTQLLGDDDYLNLTLMQRGVLHGLWLMYASHRRVLSEAEARHFLCRSAAEARRWRDTIESLNHARFIHLSASRPARDTRNPASLEVEVEKEKRSSKEESRARAKPPSRVGENVPMPTGKAAIPAIERMIRNGVITHPADLEAELSGAKLNSTDADKLRALIH
jgi:hypothetical protein